MTSEAKEPATDEIAAAVTLYYQGELEAAIAEYNRLLTATLPGDPYGSYPVAQGNGEMPEALKHLAILVEEYPEEAAYRLELAITSYLAGKPGLALENTCLLPETAETCYWQGLIFKDLEETAAIESLEKSLALQSYQPNTHYLLGELILPAATMEKPGTIF